MSNKVRNLVTGGAGFLGSHLIDKLLEAGEDVICIDNFFSGNKRNLKNWSNNRRLKIIEYDVNDFLNFEVDNNLASCMLSLTKNFLSISY